jgi:hypothetical protein
MPSFAWALARWLFTVATDSSMTSRPAGSIVLSYRAEQELVE